MKFLFAMTLVLFGWISTSSDASAATIIPLNPDPIDFFGDIVGKNKHLSQAYEFTFEGVADGVFGAIAAKIKHFTTNICLNATCSGPGAVVVAGDSWTGPFGLLTLSGNTFTGLPGGITYYLVVTGKTKHWKGGYFGLLALNVTPSTVPVPGALVLFLTAIGGLGAASHFRRKNMAA